MASPYGRNVWILCACWALSVTSATLVVSVAILAGHLLAWDKTLAALPIALQWAGTALSTVPASFIMRAIGRRGGFTVAAVMLMVGALLAIVSIREHDFLLFCVSIFIVGSGTGFTWYYRFAAAEVVDEAHRSRAISYVLAGGLFGAVVGPYIARHSVDWMLPYQFAGVFLAVLIVQALIVILQTFVRIPKPTAASLAGGRPLSVIARQPKFIIAVLGGVIAYMMMVLLMSVTPLAMQMCNLPFADAAFVIQWHALGMYVPALFSGHLVRKFTAPRVMIAGCIILVICLFVAASGITLWHFAISSTLLGIGWNFAYVGATTLLTETYTVAERAKTQALNEGLIFVCTGLGVYVSGTLLTNVGWQSVQYFALPLVLLVMAGVFWIGFRKPRPAT
ncbi:MAG: MFS transporter [Alphaproteobacteria bacterium]